MNTTTPPDFEKFWIFFLHFHDGIHEQWEKDAAMRIWSEWIIPEKQKNADWSKDYNILNDLLTTRQNQLEAEKQKTDELLKALKGLTAYFKFMVQGPQFHEYTEAVKVIAKHSKPVSNETNAKATDGN